MKTTLPYLLLVFAIGLDIGKTLTSLVDIDRESSKIRCMIIFHRFCRDKFLLRIKYYRLNLIVGIIKILNFKISTELHHDFH